MKGGGGATSYQAAGNEGVKGSAVKVGVFWRYAMRVVPACLAAHEILDRHPPARPCPEAEHCHRWHRKSTPRLVACTSLRDAKRNVGPGHTAWALHRPHGAPPRLK